MKKKFKEIEKEFNDLKFKFRQKKISEREFKEYLKDLRLKDDQGKCWTIGAQTGKWYYFDGKNWIESNPPTLKDGKAICIYCGYENNLESIVCTHCGGNIGENDFICPDCGLKLNQPDQECPECNKIKIPERSWPSLDEIEKDDKVSLPDDGGPNYIFRTINPGSLFMVLGTLGLLTGIIIGAFAGATNYFSGIVEKLPSFLLSFQGKLVGAFLFGILGGISGILIFGLFGIILAIFFNLILSLTGGIKIRLDNNE